jgi:hypothetical protein
MQLFDQSPSKLFGAASLIYEGCEVLRMVVAWGVGGAMADDGGAMFLTPILLIIVKSFTIFILVVL